MSWGSRTPSDRLRQFVDRSADSFLAHDMNGVILDVNDQLCSSLGYTRGELIGMMVWEIECTVKPHSLQGIWNRMTPMVPVTLEGRHRRRDGHEFPVEVRLQVFEDDGQMTALAMCRDISERRRQEHAAEELKRALIAARDDAFAASRAKSGFLENMSHELRTPLNAILGYAELLHEGADEHEPDALRSDLDRISDSARHLLGLINDVLDLSKIEAGKLQLVLEPTDLMDLVHDVVSMARPLARARRCELALDLQPDLGISMVDAQRLRQSLLNLLGNAVKFAEGTTIHFRAGGDRNRVWFEVRDQGIGIAPNKLEHIFEPFEQGEESTNLEFGGTGLGLPISRRVCREMGGDLTASSKLGSGSVFRIDLPRRVVRTDQVTPQPVPRQPRVQTRREVLLVHPDATCHDRIAEAFAAQPLTLRSAYDALTGTALASAIRPSVVLVDVSTPDGTAVLRNLAGRQELVTTRLLPVLIDHRVRIFGSETTTPMSFPAFAAKLVTL